MYIAHKSKDERTETLTEHLQQTSELMGKYASAFCDPNWGHIIGRYHDIGKSSPGFQKRVLHNGPKVDHSTAGCQAVGRYCGVVGAYCVAGHHGGLPDGGTRFDHSEQPTLCARLKRSPLPGEQYDPDAAGPPPAESPEIPPFIGANRFSCSFFIRMLFSCLVDADWTGTAAFMQDRIVEPIEYDGIPALNARLSAYMDGFGDAGKPLNQMRSKILSDCRRMADEPRGLFSLTVPTGGGKTLSSLAFALAHAERHGLDRVIYVIPYLSILEQNAGVFRKALGGNNVIEHHSNIEFKESDPQDAARQLSSENFDAPVVVTTGVAFFESLFSAKPGRCRKLHNIARSVVIFDEAQMIPLPYLKACVAAISELVLHYGASCVLMSATQPALKPFFPDSLPMRELMPDPGALHAFFRRTHIEHLGALTPEELAGRMRSRGQALCIVATRKQAQALLRELPEGGSYHLSTLMHPNHRRQTLTVIRQRLKDGLPCRVVSTSLIEAGVDVDFPVVYREEAGLDSVVQAAGRCNREGARPAQESAVYVFSMAGEHAARVPASMQQSIHALHQTMRSHADLSSPEAIHDYFVSLYSLKGDGALDSGRIMEMLADERGGVSFPFRQIDSAFKLIDNDTYTVVIATDADAEPLVSRLRAGERGRPLMRALGQFSVNVYRDHLMALQDAGALEPLGENGYLLTDPSLYDARVGLTLNVDRGRGFFA